MPMPSALMYTSRQAHMSASHALLPLLLPHSVCFVLPSHQCMLLFLLAANHHTPGAPCPAPLVFQPVRLPHIMLKTPNSPMASCTLPAPPTRTFNLPPAHIPTLALTPARLSPPRFLWIHAQLICLFIPRSCTAHRFALPTHPRKMREFSLYSSPHLNNNP